FSSYLMFFIFLGIIITIQLFFLPIVNTSTFFEADLMNSLDFQNSFLYLLVIQSIFAGPMIGKISEDSLIAGIRHSIILLAVSIPIYLIAMSFFA
ncbi:MAG: hypothetical protein ABH821_04620, partial [archaeon]